MINRFEISTHEQHVRGLPLRNTDHCLVLPLTVTSGDEKRKLKLLSDVLGETQNRTDLMDHLHILGACTKNCFV